MHILYCNLEAFLFFDANINLVPGFFVLRVGEIERDFEFCVAVKFGRVEGGVKDVDLKGEEIKVP